MRAFSGEQSGILVAIREKYGKISEELGGVDGVLKNFQEYLQNKMNQYLENHLNFLEKRFKELEALKKQYDSMLKDGKSPDSKEVKELSEKIKKWAISTNF
jgi:archaellum component FlaC